MSNRAYIWCNVQHHQVLRPEAMFEDIMADYANRTVTIETHPHLSTPHATIHPCQVIIQAIVLVQVAVVNTYPTGVYIKIVYWGLSLVLMVWKSFMTHIRRNVYLASFTYRSISFLIISSFGEAAFSGDEADGAELDGWRGGTTEDRSGEK